MGEVFIYGTFFGVLFMLLPVFVTVDFYVDLGEKTAWFSVSLYRYFRLLGGYLQPVWGGIAFHIKKKAIFLPYQNMSTAKKKFEITKGFQLWRFHQVIETGGANTPYGVLVAAFVQSVSAGIFSVLRTRHPFLSLKNSLLMTNRSELKLSAQTIVVFNGFVLSIALTKKITEVFLNWIRKKRFTKYSKERQNN